YEHSGTYHICLAIKTKQGCERTICRELEISEENNNCIAAFTYEKIPGNKFRFNSSLSSAAQNDSIVARIWHWGEGTIEDGNHFDPIHYYGHSGDYLACLTIKTKKGCVQEKCETISIDS